MNFIPHVRIQSAGSLLKEIVDAVQAAGVLPQRPRVRIRLRDEALEGIPIGIESVNKTLWVALYSPNDGTREMEQVSYVDVEQISAVSVLDVRSALRFVTDSSFSPASGRDLPSRLTVNLLAKETAKVLKEASGKTIAVDLTWPPGEAGSVAALYFQSALTALRDYVLVNQQYEMTTNGLARLKAVELEYRNSGDFSLSIEKSRLRLDLGAASDPANLGNDLRRQLEEKLKIGD